MPTDVDWQVLDEILAKLVDELCKHWGEPEEIDFSAFRGDTLQLRKNVQRVIRTLDKLLQERTFGYYGCVVVEPDAFTTVVRTYPVRFELVAYRDDGEQHKPRFRLCAFSSIQPIVIE